MPTIIPARNLDDFIATGKIDGKFMREALKHQGIDFKSPFGKCLMGMAEQLTQQREMMTQLASHIDFLAQTLGQFAQGMEAYQPALDKVQRQHELDEALEGRVPVVEK